MSRRRWILAVVAALGVGAGGFVALGLLTRPGDEVPRDERPLRLRSQSFERDPRWRAAENRRLGACTTTRQAFGPLPGGGLGGVVTRNARPTWFGRQVKLDFDRPFNLEGELVVKGTEPGEFPSGSVIVGLFNQANRDWRPPNLLAFQVNADTVPGGGDYSLVLAYGARNYEQAHVAHGGDESPAGLRFGRPYRWRMSYDPRAEDGLGRLTLAIPGTGAASSLTLAPSARRAGATLNRLGVGNQVMARGEALDFEVRDLRLDGVGQPASLGLDGVAQPASTGDGWAGEGNRAEFRDCLTGQPNDFGWTGPDDRRLGGLIARTDEQRPEARALYADQIGRLSLDDRLHAEGTVELDRANTDSATLLGWFRAGSSAEGSGESAPPDFMGIAITGPSRIGQYFGPLASGKRGEAETRDGEDGMVFNPQPGRRVRWSFDYYPLDEREGLVVVGLDGRRLTWRIPERLRRQGATFNRFGMRNLERGGSFQVVYFDDLRYSFGAPEGGDEGDDEGGRDQRGEDRDGEQTSKDQDRDGEDGDRHRGGDDKGDRKREKRRKRER